MASQELEDELYPRRRQLNAHDLAREGERLRPGDTLTLDVRAPGNLHLGVIDAVADGARSGIVGTVKPPRDMMAAAFASLSSAGFERLMARTGWQAPTPHELVCEVEFERRGAEWPDLCVHPVDALLMAGLELSAESEAELRHICDEPITLAPEHQPPRPRDFTPSERAGLAAIFTLVVVVLICIFAALYSSKGSP